MQHLLQSAGKKAALLSTVKNKIGDQEFSTQLTTQQPDYLHAFFNTCIDADIEYVVMEVAAQALSLHRVAGLEFDGIIFTNFAQAHGEFYASEEDYFVAKASLFLQGKADAKLVINADDQKGAELLERYSDATPFASKGVTASLTSNSAKGITGLLSGLDGSFGFTCPSLIGDFNLYNILAASAMAWRLGLPASEIVAALATFAGVPGRLEKYQLPNGAVSFIDYAHNPLSFQSVLPLLRSMTDHLIVVAGAGGDRDRAMRPVMGQLMAECADQVIITSDNPRSENPEDIAAAIYAGVPVDKKDKVQCELDREKAICKAYALSRERTIIALLGKGPDEYQIVGATKYPFSERNILKSL